MYISKMYISMKMFNCCIFVNLKILDYYSTYSAATSFFYAAFHFEINPSHSNST